MSQLTPRSDETWLRLSLRAVGAPTVIILEAVWSVDGALDALLATKIPMHSDAPIRRSISRAWISSDAGARACESVPARAIERVSPAGAVISMLSWAGESPIVGADLARDQEALTRLAGEAGMRLLFETRAKVDLHEAAEALKRRGTEPFRGLRRLGLRELAAAAGHQIPARPTPAEQLAAAAAAWRIVAPPLARLAELAGEALVERRSGGLPFVPAPGADLHHRSLIGADLAGLDLHGAILRGADLRGADLSGSKLTGADLRGADLSGADLRGADLTGADLDGARLTHAIR